jgi:hypothetical protein
MGCDDTDNCCVHASRAEHSFTLFFCPPSRIDRLSWQLITLHPVAIRTGTACYRNDMTLSCCRRRIGPYIPHPMSPSRRARRMNVPSNIAPSISCPPGMRIMVASDTGTPGGGKAVHHPLRGSPRRRFTHSLPRCPLQVHPQPPTSPPRPRQPSSRVPASTRGKHENEL